MTAERGAAELGRASRVTIRRVTMRDLPEFTRLAKASRALHRPWIHAPTTPGEFGAYLNRCDRISAEGLLVCLRGTGAIAGFATIDQIVGGPYQRGVLGYGAFAPTAGRGYMTEGLGLVVRFAFDDLGLHRLEADVQPHNAASLRLIDRLGFRREGLSPGFVLIDGVWRDHERWAITSDMVPR